jgi:DNA polymerase elongation subunit (family B)
MNFKSEVVAYRGFFRGKKYYALAKIWDEGNFLDKPKLKKTGGQLVKSDVTSISKDLITEIYETLVLEFELDDINKIYRKIFKELYNKYKIILKEAINNFDIDKFTIPKKWGVGNYKQIPTHVKGAMLYNLIFKNTIRPGDGIRAVQIKINNFKKLINTYNQRKKERLIDEYTIPLEEINKKLNIISFPYDSTSKEEILKVLEEYGIVLDYDTILDFNIDKKIVQFQDLFSEDVKRKNS